MEAGPAPLAGVGRLGLSLAIAIPSLGIPALLVTRWLSWLYSQGLYAHSLPTISKIAAFSPASSVFTPAMTAVAVAIVLGWPIVYALNARIIEQAIGGAAAAGRLRRLNGAVMLSGVVAGLALAGLAIVTLEVNDPAHMALSKLFFAAQVLALLGDTLLASRLNARAPGSVPVNGRFAMCAGVFLCALVFLVLFLVKDAALAVPPMLVRWLYVGSESALCALLLCYSLTYVPLLRRAAAEEGARPARLADVLAAYRPRFANELRTEWAAALLYRPLSLALTPRVAGLGVAPSAVTLLGAGAALSLPVVAVSGGGATAVGLLAAACCVLDCLDGDLARVTGRVSTRGAYADFLADLVYRICLYAALGLLAGAALGLAVGLVAAILAVLARCCRFYAERPGTAGAAPGLVFSFLSGIDHLLPVALIVLGALDALPWLLGYVVLYSLGDFVLTQRAVLARLR